MQVNLSHLGFGSLQVDFVKKLPQQTFTTVCVQLFSASKGSPRLREDSHTFLAALMYGLFCLLFYNPLLEPDSRAFCPPQHGNTCLGMRDVIKDEA